MESAQTAAVGSLRVLFGRVTAGRAGAGPAAEGATRVLQAQVAEGRTPSVQYRFFSPASILFAYDEGVADVGEGARVTRATTYNVFSITKTFTAVAVLQLAEQGLLALDAPAADFHPAFPYGRQITVRQLLTHSAGIADPIPLRWTHLESEHEQFDRDGFFSTVFARRQTLRNRPNEQFAYSNLGYVLLGQIIEAVSGMSYEEYVLDRVVGPIGVAPGEIGFTLDTAIHARGYHRRNTFSHLALAFLIDRKKYMEPSPGPWQPFRPYHVNGAAYGGMIGTADGFARYGRALLDPQHRLLSEDSRHALFTENILRSGAASGMGLSWFHGELEGNAYLAHAGGGGGYYAEIRIYPELQRGSMILFNRTGMADRRFLDRIDAYLIR